MRPDGQRPTIVGSPDGPEDPFPIRLGGKVVVGFGRGSKELGIPTANLPVGSDIDGNDGLDSGIYYGFASLSSVASASQQPEPDRANATPPRVYPMVMSLGYNPFYKNTIRSVEVHIMHTFLDDFYGAEMRLVILGFIRPEYDYVSKESLIDDIRTDIEVTRKCLEREPYSRFEDDSSLVV